MLSSNEARLYTRKQLWQASTLFQGNLHSFWPGSDKKLMWVPSTVENCQWSDNASELSKITSSEWNCAIFCYFLPSNCRNIFYSSCSIVEIHLVVYKCYYQYFSLNTVFHIVIFPVFQGHFNFWTPCKWLESFDC